MYPKPEMAHIRQIEILVNKKDMPWINRIMLGMDYEQKEESMGSGVVYVRVPGVRIVFYDEIPIENKVIRHYFSGSVRSYHRIDSYKFIHTLTNLKPSRNVQLNHPRRTIQICLLIRQCMYELV